MYNSTRKKAIGVRVSVEFYNDEDDADDNATIQSGIQRNHASLLKANKDKGQSIMRPSNPWEKGKLTPLSVYSRYMCSEMI